MRIAVLETGATRPPLREQHGNYPEMLIKLIAAELPNATFSSISIVNGDPVPAARDYDGFVIMGSRHSVHDDLPWINSLKKLIADCANLAVPQVGICFGHQIIAEAMGGRVEHSKAGWTAGLENYKIIDETGTSSADTIASYAFHQEQIAEKPDLAATVLSTDTCPYAGLTYGDKRIFSVQCHPEFEAPYIQGLIRLTKGDSLPSEVADQALRSLSLQPHRQRMARAIAVALTDGDAADITASLAGRPNAERIDPAN